MQGLVVGPYKKSNEVLPRYAEHSPVTGAGQNVRRPRRWCRYIASYVDNVPDTENPVSTYNARLSILHRRTGSNEDAQQSALPPYQRGKMKTRKMAQTELSFIKPCFSTGGVIARICNIKRLHRSSGVQGGTVYHRVLLPAVRLPYEANIDKIFFTNYADSFRD
ncbi:Uncharacterized protein DBV15_01128 [Temnothorax longispinosus]|uniref:Uncharacterized protein n=1 Tax=Temnothorax longispinosus TaxID=300112 RepID=A0A4S2JCM1_9HYME|nr:Uncharacterized protein DBV15_01128 [Temnothorax longispinosus]